MGARQKNTKLETTSTSFERVACIIRYAQKHIFSLLIFLSSVWAAFPFFHLVNDSVELMQHTSTPRPQVFARVAYVRATTMENEKWRKWEERLFQEEVKHQAKAARDSQPIWHILTVLTNSLESSWLITKLVVERMLLRHCLIPRVMHFEGDVGWRRNSIEWPSEFKSLAWEPLR